MLGLLVIETRVSVWVLLVCRYFRELWACAVFHDRFPDLREEVRELLSQPAVSEARRERAG